MYIYLFIYRLSVWNLPRQTPPNWTVSCFYGELIYVNAFAAAAVGCDLLVEGCHPVDGLTNCFIAIDRPCAAVCKLPRPQLPPVFVRYLRQSIATIEEARPTSVAATTCSCLQPLAADSCVSYWCRTATTDIRLGCCREAGMRNVPETSPSKHQSEAAVAEQTDTNEKHPHCHCQACD
jgi:hypothetical protein